MISFELPRVVELEYRGGYRLWLRFSDGVAGEVDLSDAIREYATSATPRSVLAPLYDRSLFAQVRLEAGTAVWPNGADWSPESLHERVLASKEYGTRRDGDSDRMTPHDLRRMPEISRFFGIIIRMFYDDHSRPHLHAQYGEHVLRLEIAGNGMRGSFPPARLPLLFEWRDRHRAELLENWDRLRRGEAPLPVAPLE